MADRITAVFDNENDAERAINDLRRHGMSDDRLGIMKPHHEAGEEMEGEDTGERAAKGLGIGAGIGAIFGLAASLIPGVGPFITAGFLANLLGAVAGGVVSGAIVGGTVGALTGALIKAGYSEEEAQFCAAALESGGVMVSVDMENSALSAADVRNTLADYGGRFAGAEMERRAA